MAFPQLLVLSLFVTAIVGLFWHNISRVNSGGLHPELVKAAVGNKALARRLLQQVQIKYPGKSDRWYREKVIYDLNRDRGGIRASRSQFNFNDRKMRENIFLIGGILWILNSFSSLVSRWFR